jgi:hypothetical protein
LAKVRALRLPASDERCVLGENLLRLMGRVRSQPAAHVIVSNGAVTSQSELHDP